MTDRVSVVFDGTEESRKISRLLVFNPKEEDIMPTRIRSFRKVKESHTQALRGVTSGGGRRANTGGSERAPKRQKQVRRQKSSTKIPYVAPTPKQFAESIDVIYEGANNNVHNNYTRLSDWDTYEIPEIDMTIEEEKVEEEDDRWENDIFVDGVLFESQEGFVAGKEHLWYQLANAEKYNQEKAIRGPFSPSKERKNKKKKKNGIQHLPVSRARPPAGLKMGDNVSCARTLPYENAKKLANWSHDFMEYPSDNRNLELVGRQAGGAGLGMPGLQG